MSRLGCAAAAYASPSLLTLSLMRANARVQPSDIKLCEEVGLAQVSWSGERNLLPAFADPEIARAVGFKQAAKCLCSHSCELCEVNILSRECVVCQLVLTCISRKCGALLLHRK